MSFQGDVAGIGLGELLQGLARGERNGVLTLTGKRISAAVGLRRGQIFLLPGPDEDEYIWRDRCVRAYADNQDGNLEPSRRATVARASRLETFYQIMEASNLHFRFDPGPLPPSPSAALRTTDSTPRGQRAIQIDAGAEQEYEEEEEDLSHLGPGMPVEYLLLEHARISDEVRMGLGAKIFGFDLPRALDPERQSPDVRDFLEQCNGSSTIQEIADRIGWPLSKCRGVIGDYVGNGLVRIAQARELLASAQREMEIGRPGRAATRLSGWLYRSAPGPLTPADAQLLVNEWTRERLQKALAVIEPRDGRAVLRRLDLLENNKKAAHERWKLIAESHKQDEIILLHEVALRLSASEPNSRTFSDILRLAHSFSQRGLAQRTRMLLRLCANHLPEGGAIRVELGRRMLEAGLMAEGSRWLLNTARELLAAQDGEAALLPIRAVLRVAPEDSEARALLDQAQVVKIKRKRRRLSLAVGLSFGLTLSLAAAVKFHSYREAERWISSVDEKSPSEALLQLDLEFGQDPPTRIQELRARLTRSHHEEQLKKFDDWSRTYREAEEACTFGDPLLGFAKAVELPKAPRGSAPSTPDTTNLLGQLARRLGTLAQELDASVDAPLEQLKEEERLLDLLAELRETMKARDLPLEAHSFQFRIDELHGEVDTRRATRANIRERVLAKEKEKDQDILLATARAHDQAGDLERALSAYKRLLETDPELALIPDLQQEIERVRTHHEALETAISLCEEGRHAEAERVLRPVCPRTIEHLLPFHVDSLPSGAQVTFSDGRVRTTPFTGKSGLGEHVTLKFELAGFQERTLELSKPTDVVMFMNLFPERVWESPNKVQAAPVPSGDDHIVADRRGRVARLGQDSQVAWEVTLPTLGGIARTPMFLPNKSGWILVVSEDGMAWIIQSKTGEIEGPRDIGSPPTAGPELTRGGASIQFADGRVGVWTDKLEPVFYHAEPLAMGTKGNLQMDSSGLAVLQRGARANPELVSPWNDWKATVREGEYRVIHPDGRGFSAVRSGEWAFMAWEQPKALVPNGRFWVSDEDGLRSFIPDVALMVPYPTEE